MKNPTAKQIEDAKKYLMQMIEEQHLAQDELEELFGEAAERIASIVAKYISRNMTLRFKGSGLMATEIKEVVEWFKSEYDSIINRHSVPEEEELGSLVLEKVHGLDHGATMKERVSLYLDNYISDISDNIWNESDVDIEDISNTIREAVSSRENKFNLLALNSIAIGFSYSAYKRAAVDGALGYMVMRGSNNPCDLCVEKHNKLYPISNTADMPPFHPYCKCFAVYIYE